MKIKDDLKNHCEKERHVADLLFNQGLYEQLSPDAKLVLDLATDLFKKSMKKRIEIESDPAYEKYHLNSWDAGYAQLKIIWKEFFPQEFKEFKEAYKKLEDRLRPLVYELGFLKDTLTILEEPELLHRGD